MNPTCIPMTDKARYAEVMEVTPQQAAAWLEGNTDNRPLNQAHVERLAADMKAKRWQLTHQGLAFDSAGVLLDGQHRLWAVIEAEIPVTFRVFFNEPPEARLVLDCGKPRNNLDILTLTGQAGQLTSKHLATLRAMLCGTAIHRPSLSAGEEAAQLARHRDAVDFAIQHLNACGQRGVTTAQIRAVIARAYYLADTQRLAHFCDVLRSGIPADDTDHVVLALREYLTRCYSAGLGESAQRLRYTKTEWALRAFLNGRVPKRLFSAEFELFPLPTEINPTAKSA